MRARPDCVRDVLSEDCLTESAEALKLSEFNVTEVRCTPGGFYHSRESVLDSVARFKIDLTVVDDAATRIAHELIGSVRPESLTILKLDHSAPVTDEAAVRSTRNTAVPLTLTPASVAAH